MEPQKVNWTRILLKNFIISIVLTLLLYLILSSMGGIPLSFIPSGIIISFIIINIIEYIYQLTHVIKNGRPIILGFAILILVSFFALIFFTYILK